MDPVGKLIRMQVHPKGEGVLAVPAQVDGTSRCSSPTGTPPSMTTAPLATHRLTSLRRGSVLLAPPGVPSW